MTVDVGLVGKCGHDLLAPVGKASGIFAAGDNVDALWRGRWYQGVVANLNQDGSYDIHFCDGDERLGESCDPHRR